MLPSSMPDDTCPSYSDALGREERQDLVDGGFTGSYPGNGQDNGQKLSTNAIIRLAGEIFIKNCSQKIHDLLVIGHPNSCSYLGLSAEDARDVDLIGYLLASAEKVDLQQFEDAILFLRKCIGSCSSEGTPVQRLVYYFSQSLDERVNQQLGRVISKGIRKRSLDIEEALRNPRIANSTAVCIMLPFPRITEYAIMHAILEKVAGAKKVHVIDMAIFNGSFCRLLMQTLAARSEFPLEHLKVTALGTKLKQNLEETGKQLIAFASSINLSFSFHVVVVADMLDLNESLFEVDSEEVIAVHSSYLLSSMIAKPDRLDCLMRVIRNVNPCIMVFTDCEGNLNSPVFVNRFVEALFFYGALFDCLGDCMDHRDPDRLFLESELFCTGIRSSVAVGGEERIIRYVSDNVWRKFFSSFGMVQLDLSSSTLNQARLVVERFACWSSCTLDMDEKSLIIGWKGTPVHSLSVWKFV